MTRARGAPSLPATSCSATTNSPSPAPPVSRAATRYSFRLRRSAGTSLPPSRVFWKVPMIRSPALSSRRMILASMSPVSSGTSRAAARSPTFNTSLAPLSMMRKIGAGSGPGQATGRASASPSSSLPTRSMTVTSGSGGVATKRRLAARVTAPERSILRSMSRSSGRLPGATEKARAISRLPTAEGLSRMKARSSAAEGRSPRRCSPETICARFHHSAGRCT